MPIHHFAQDKPIQAMIEGCAAAGQPASQGRSPLAELRVQRFNALCKACNKAESEALLWVDYTHPHHPLSW